VEDPLRDRKLTGSTGKCDYRDVMISGKKANLSPGVYCGGIVVINESRVRLASGSYTFVNGDLDIASGSKLVGNRVNLHFARNSRLFLRNNSIVELSAPRSGSMAGILVSSSRANNASLTFDVKSKNARKLTGLFYLPNHTLVLGDDADQDGVCDTKDDEYRLPHPLSHTHDHAHPNGTVHSHMHFMTGSFPTNSDGITIHGPKSHTHTDTVGGAGGCTANVGELSDWTAIIAKKIEITSGVKLVLNADYEDSVVPVPMNDGSVGITVSLTE